MESYAKEINFKRKKVIKEIVSFVSLNPNWDGYGALPLEVESAANAILLTNQFTDNNLDKISDLCPNPHGTISFDWKNESQERISLEIGNTSFSYYAQLSSSESQIFKNLSFDTVEINTLVNFINQI